jgi:hypothetical protein
MKGQIMANVKPKIPAVLTVFSLLCYSFTLAQNEYYKEISRTNEKELRVTIESSFKKVVLSKGYSDKIFVIQHVPDDNEAPDVNIKYRVDGERGNLRIDLSEEGGWEQMKSWLTRANRSQGLENDTWYIKLNSSIPIKLDVDVGAGSSNIDITGLIVKEFKLSTGASSTSVVCNEPNTVVMDVFTIEAGLAKFYGGSLGNANFKSLRFEGGVGSYALDFSGALRRESNVSVDIGLGSINIFLPKNIGAQVRYDQGFLSSHTFEDFKEIGDGKYISNNYYDSEGKLSIRIETGLGSVKIKRVNK